MERESDNSLNVTAFFANQIELMRKGDRNAIIEIYESLRPNVLGFCKAMTCDEHDAEDVCSDTINNVFHYITTTTVEIEKPIALAIKIARRLCINRYRRNAAEARLMTGLVRITDFERKGPDLVHEDKDFIERMKKEIAKQPEFKKRVLQARLLQGMTSEETAEMFNITARRVNQILREFRKLAQGLAGE